MAVLAYQEFLKSKRLEDVDSGFEVAQEDLNCMLFPFQKQLTQWALRRGRAAIFADCGLGKSPIQITWAQRVSNHTGRPVLIVAPLAVSRQTQREGDKFGVPITICRTQADIGPTVNVTNYEMLSKFDPSEFGGLVLDESSILKGFFRKTRAQLIEFASGIPYRLACTATPAPNDTMELVNHAEYLGVMTADEVLALFFTQAFDAKNHKWRLKGHAVKDFWTWLCSWAVALRRPSDLGFDDNGFILPSLEIEHHTIETDPTMEGRLITEEARGIQEQRRVRRGSINERVALLADLCNSNDEQWVVWCDLNAESAAATLAINGAIEVKGADKHSHKENAMIGFAGGEHRVIVTKPSIAGFGMNWQNCHNVAFLGLSNSFESYYQAVRRCWRFGQESNVNVHIITSDREGGVKANIERKEAEASKMYDELIEHQQEANHEGLTREVANYATEAAAGENWSLFLGDSIETIHEIESESVGLVVFSPPFPGMYVYTNSPRDVGNVKDFEELIEHYAFLAAKDKLMRVLMPGRSCCVHLTQGPAFKHIDGYVGLKDFRGRIISAMTHEGWIYYGEVVIDKNPQLKALRTKDQGLLFKTLAADSAKCRMATPDYILQFHKPGDNPEPICAGKADHIKGHTGGWISNAQWVEWAAPIWYRKTENYPGGISETDVLNVSSARSDGDEKHLCPLQLGVIDRLVLLWSNPGDLIYSPFAGVGSEGVGALRNERRFVGGELKESYYRQAIKNLTIQEESGKQLSLL